MWFICRDAMGMGMFMWASGMYMCVHLHIMYVEARGQLWALCLRSHFVHWDKITHWLGAHEVARLAGQGVPGLCLILPPWDYKYMPQPPDFQSGF